MRFILINFQNEKYPTYSIAFQNVKVRHGKFSRPYHMTMTLTTICLPSYLSKFKSSYINNLNVKQ